MSPPARSRWLVALCLSVACHAVLGRLAGAAADEVSTRPVPQRSSAWVGETVDVETVLSESLANGEPALKAATSEGLSAVPSVAVAKTRAGAEDPSRAPERQVGPASVEPPRTVEPLGEPDKPSVTREALRSHGESPESAERGVEPHRSIRRPSSTTAAEGTNPITLDPLARAASNALGFRPAAPNAGAFAPGDDPSLAHSDADAGSSSFGAAGMPPGVRELGAALTRNLPLAGQREPTWDQVAIGTEDRAVLRVALSAEGMVSDWHLEPRPVGEHPRRIKELARRAVALLGRGQFALSAGLGSGSQRAELVIRVEQSESHGDDFVRPEDLFAQGFEPPAGARPGKAYLRLNSGRTLRMELRLLSD